MANNTFATSVGCMDGRVQDLVAEFARGRWGALYIDTITEAGLAKYFSLDREIDTHSQNLLEMLKIKIVDVSIGKHSSRGIVVHGHQDCAGNPVDEETQKKQIIKAASTIRDMVKKDLEVIPVFVSQKENGWRAEEL